MDLNFPAQERESLCIGEDERATMEENKESVEKVLAHGVEEEKARDGRKENGVSDMEKGNEVKVGGFIRRASRRKSCQLAKEKIERLNDDFYEWEAEEKPRRGRKRKRKGVQSEDNGGETVGEEKKGKDEEKPRRGRKRKRTGGKSEENGGENVGEEKNEEKLRVPWRKRKGVKSEDDAAETVGAEKSRKEDCPKGMRERNPLKDGAEEEVEGEKSEWGTEGGEGTHSLRTKRDRQDNAARRKGRRKLEENVNDFGVLVFLCFTFVSIHFSSFLS